MNDIAQEMLTTFSDDPDLLKKVIAGDESWVYGYGIEVKVQSSQWTRPEEPFYRIVKNRRAHKSTTNLSICRKQTDNPKCLILFNISDNRHVYQHNRKKNAKIEHRTHVI